MQRQLLFLSLLTYVFILLTNHATANPAEEVIRFPSVKSLGRVTLINPQAFGFVEENRNKQFDAAGNISIPAGSQIGWYLNYNALEHLNNLDKSLIGKVALIDARKLADMDLGTFRKICVLKNLRSLNLAETDMDDKCIELISDSFPTLTSLSVQKTLVTGDTLDKLQKIGRLRRLSTGYNVLSSRAYGNIAKLQSLTTLELNYCGLTDTDVKLLQKLPQLDSLSLAGNNRLTDVGMNEICHLKNLTSLDIFETGITDKSLPYLLKMKSLKKLRIGSKRGFCYSKKFVEALEKHEVTLERDNTHSVPAEIFSPLH